jgi:hypothetical protein
MKKVLIVIFLTITLSLSGTTFYVSTTGKDSNPGTITQPFASWDYALNLVVAGDIVYIRGGVYYTSGRQSSGSYNGVRVYNRNGTSKNPIRVMAYPGETPVLDCSNITQSGIHVGFILDNCVYWNLKGLTVTNVNEYNSGTSYPYPSEAFSLADCSNITLEQCSVHGCGHGFTLDGYNDYIYYTNCDSYENHDHFNNGDLANGYSINIGASSHVFYEGCRAWLNSDDGWDAFSVSYGSGFITWKNCWAFENGAYGGVIGNGAGFKSGMSYLSEVGTVQRSMINCISFKNTGIGFDESQDDGATSIPHIVYNCTSYDNGEIGFNFQFGAGSNGFVADIFRNNISYNERISFGWNNNIVDHNSWQNGLTVSDADFVSLNSDQAKSARQADGSLPVITFLHLTSGSDLVDAGTDVGQSFSGRAPDLGAFELQTTPNTPVPVYISSVVENATPTLLEMTYDLTLNSLIVPGPSAFNVLVNTVKRNVNIVTVTGTKVQLALASDVKFGDIITVSYTKPSTNPLQSSTGREAESISLKPVTNNCKDPAKPNDPPVVVIRYSENSNSGFVYEIDASGTYDLNKDPLTYEWIAPENFSVSSISGSRIRFLAPVVTTTQSNEFQLKVNDGKTVVSASIPINIIPYKPELYIARVSNIEASSYQSPDFPKNISDGNTATQWSATGDNQWLLIQLAEPFKISHIEISFLPQQRYSSYFDIYASKDNLVWEPILTNATSCNFTGNMQVFDFPLLKIYTLYAYIKAVGHGNTSDKMNVISEFKIFGLRQDNAANAEARSVIVYPNPAFDYFNISIEEPELNPDFVRLIDFSGKIVFEDSFEQSIKNIQIPSNLKAGIYTIELKSAKITVYAQKLVVIR